MNVSKIKALIQGEKLIIKFNDKCCIYPRGAIHNYNHVCGLNNDESSID